MVVVITQIKYTDINIFAFMKSSHDERFNKIN